MTKHGLAKYHATEGYTVKTAYEPAIFSNRNAVGITLFMKLSVCIHDFMGDPGAVLLFSFSGCAGANYRSKIIINADALQWVY